MQHNWLGQVVSFVMGKSVVTRNRLSLRTGPNAANSTDASLTSGLATASTGRASSVAPDVKGQSNQPPSPADLSFPGRRLFADRPRRKAFAAGKQEPASDPAATQSGSDHDDDHDRYADAETDLAYLTVLFDRLLMEKHRRFLTKWQIDLGKGRAQSDKPRRWTWTLVDAKSESVPAFYRAKRRASAPVEPVRSHD